MLEQSAISIGVLIRLVVTSCCLFPSFLIMWRLPSIQVTPLHTRSFSNSRLLMRALTIDGLNPALQKVQYAVRGELAIKAEVLRDTLKNPNHGLPFDKVISSNIGNPQQKGLDQPPITFTRQVRASIICASSSIDL